MKIDDYNEIEDFGDESEEKLNATNELATGIPEPSKYNQFLINKYSFPKALISIQKSKNKKSKRDDKKLLVNPPYKRKGIIGWKLSRQDPNKSSDETSQFIKRSSSTKPSSFIPEPSHYVTSVVKMYNSVSKDSIPTSKTLDPKNPSYPILTNDRLHFIANPQLTTALPPKEIGTPLLKISMNSPKFSYILELAVPNPKNRVGKEGKVGVGR